MQCNCYTFSLTGKKMDFLLNRPIPFLWQMSKNVLAISKYISVLGKTISLLMHTNVYRWKNYTGYCLTLFTTSPIPEKIYDIYHCYRAYCGVFNAILSINLKESQICCTNIITMTQCLDLGKSNFNMQQFFKTCSFLFSMFNQEVSTILSMIG